MLIVEFCRFDSYPDPNGVLAQSGRASGLGPEGQTFKSFIRDQIYGEMVERFNTAVLKTAESVRVP